MFKLFRPFLVVSLFLGFASLQAATLDLTPESRSSIGLLIYNDDLALVNDRFTINLPAGKSLLNFSTVSPLINHASAVLHPLPKTLHVQDQYFRNAMTPRAMLQQAVGQTVSLVSTHPVSGEKTYERARVLSVNEGLILEISGRYETDLAGRRIVYDQLPQGVLKPTLSVSVDSIADTQSNLILSYLTGGISWQADYVAQLNTTEGILQLRAMATITNQSGTDFQAAHIELAAGTVNRVRSNGIAERGLARAVAMDTAPVKPVALADLYLYTLPGPADLANNSTRQMALFEARDVPVERQYQLSGQGNIYYSPKVPEQSLKVDSYIAFSNDSDHNLGLPMPEGVVRVYSKADAEPDTLRFIGEDRISHTPANGFVRLKTGRAFDLSGTRKQVAYRRLPVEAPFHQNSEVKVQIELSNAKSEAVMVQIWENFSGEWTLVEGPEPIESYASSARWDLGIPALGKAVLNLTIRVKR